MKIQIAVEVKDKKEAKAIEKALQSADIKAFVLIAGLLVNLPQDVRKRVLDYTKSRKFWYDLQKKR